MHALLQCAYDIWLRHGRNFIIIKLSDGQIYIEAYIVVENMNWMFALIFESMILYVNHIIGPVAVYCGLLCWWITLNRMNHSENWHPINIINIFSHELVLFAVAIDRTFLCFCNLRSLDSVLDFLHLHIA